MAKVFHAVVSLALLACAGAVYLRSDKAPAAAAPAQAPAPAAPAPGPLPATVNVTEAVLDLGNTTEVNAIVSLLNASAYAMFDKVQEALETAIADIGALGASDSNASEDIASLVDTLMGLQVAVASTLENALVKFTSILGGLDKKILDAASKVHDAFDTLQAKIQALRAVKNFLLRYAAAGRTFWWPFGGSKPSPEKQAETALSKANETVLAFGTSVTTLNTTFFEGMATVVATMQEKLASFQEGCSSAIASASAGALANQAASINSTCMALSALSASAPGLPADAMQAAQEQIGLMRAKAQKLLLILSNLANTVTNLEEQEAADKEGSETSPAADTKTDTETSPAEGNSPEAEMQRKTDGTLQEESKQIQTQEQQQQEQ